MTAPLPFTPPAQRLDVELGVMAEETMGTGLGLATCQATAAEHPGHIDQVSEVGKGTQMVVAIPCSR